MLKAKRAKRGRYEYEIYGKGFVTFRIETRLAFARYELTTNSSTSTTRNIIEGYFSDNSR